MIILNSFRKGFLWLRNMEKKKKSKRKTPKFWPQREMSIKKKIKGTNKR